MKKTIEKIFIIICIFSLFSLAALSSPIQFITINSSQEDIFPLSPSPWYSLDSSLLSKEPLEQGQVHKLPPSGLSNGEVLFTGRVITNESSNDFPICYDLPHCNVTLTNILLDPENLLSIPGNVSICYNKSRMIPPLNLTVGHDIEVYGFFHDSTGPFQYVGHVLIAFDPYYVKLLGINNPPDTPLLPSGPTTGIVYVSYPYYTAATDPDGDSVRYRFDWGDGTYSTWSPLYSSGTLAYTYNLWPQPGIYQVRSQAMDEYGAQGMWSSPLTVTITGGNSPPYIPPRPTGPTSGTPQVSYTYSVSTTDPEGDMILYYFDWGDGLGTWTNPTPSGQSVSQSHSWETTGLYQVRIKAKDEHGAESDWSPSLTLELTGNNPPNQPTKPSGLQIGKKGRSYTYTSVTIDPDNDQIYYLFDWGDGTDSGWNGPYASGQTATVSHIWANPGSYPIKVKAKDLAGEESVWSEPLSLVMHKTIQARWQTLYNTFLAWLIDIIN